MIFKDINIGTNTEINKQLFYQMARNDDIIKLYYESCRAGVLGWTEIESSIYIPTRLTPEQIELGDLGEGEDPTWATIATLPLIMEDRRVIKITTSAFMNVHQATSGIATAYRPSLEIRYTFDYPEEFADEVSAPKAITLIPYVYLSNGHFLIADRTREYGRIYAQNIAVSTNDFLLAKSNATRIKKYQKYNLIKPGKSFLNVKVKKLDVPQNLFASGENKVQIMVEDCGAWR